MNRRIKYALAGAAIAGAVAWGGGLLWFASTIPVDISDTTTHTDAIVVLTGGSERIETGLRLLADGLADRMFVSGAGHQIRAEDLLSRTSTPQPDVAGKIAVGTSASDTPGNAAETAAWARAEGVHSIRLVTAAYHMRRSLLEFHAAMPGMIVIPHAVFPMAVKSDWWRWPGTARLVASEYTKYMLTVARQNIRGPDDGAGGEAAS